MSEHFEQYPTTPGDDGSNTRTPVYDLFPSLHVEDIDKNNDDDDENDNDDDDNDAQLTQNNTKSNKGKERWTMKVDEALVSGYSNCGGDPEVGTDQSKVKLWKEIRRLYAIAQKRNLAVIQARTPKALKARWRTLNKEVNSWVGVYAEANRSRISGSSEDDVENKAAQLFEAKTNGRRFKFRHCWVEMRHFQKWQVVDHNVPYDSEGSAKRSSGVVGFPPRPDGVNKAKRKGKTVATSSSKNVDVFTTSLTGLKEERNKMSDQVSEIIAYQKERDEKKFRFKMFTLFLRKPSLEPHEQQYFEKLKEEFMN